MPAARISSRWLVNAPVTRWNTPGATLSLVPTVTATVDKIKTDYKIKVALPDEVAVVGATDAQNVPVGTTVALTAEVKDNGAAIAELAAKVE